MYQNHNNYVYNQVVKKELGEKSPQAILKEEQFDLLLFTEASWWDFRSYTFTAYSRHQDSRKTYSRISTTNS